MNHACKAFWMLDTIIGHLPIPPGFSLTYHVEFLKPVKTPITPPYPVVPPAPRSVEVEQCAGDRTLWRGET